MTFDEPAKRIIAYGSAPVEFLFAMGEGHRLAGTHIYATYPPEAEAIPKVGDSFNINFEKILELEPDLIYTFFGSSVPDLEALGIKVLYLDTPDTLPEIAQQIRTWGKIVGNVEGAEEVAKGFEARVDNLLSKLVSVEAGPRVFHDQSDFWTAGPDTLIGRIYTLLKANNIAVGVSGYAQLSPEVIVERDPQVIVTTFPGRADAIESNPGFSDVTAIKQGRVYTVDAGPISVAGLRTVDGIEELAKLVHPEQFGLAIATPAPVLITDSDGKVVSFTEPPQRIVAYGSAPVEFLFAMGEGDRLAGTHIYADYPPEAEAIPKVGDSFNINFEKILELEPDLIYTFYGSSVPDLEELGIKVLYLDTPEDLPEIAAQIRTWGQIVGNVDGAEEVAKGFEARVNDLLGKLASVEAGPRVFHDQSDFWTAGPDTLIGRIYTLLKAENIAQDITGYVQLSPEVIVERDPQVIVTTFPGRAEEIQSNPAFANISAIKEGRVYTVDASPISVAGLRTVDGIEEIAALIHPELFQAGPY